jgi:hypothetical protein
MDKLGIPFGGKPAHFEPNTPIPDIFSQFQNINPIKNDIYRVIYVLSTIFTASSKVPSMQQSFIHAWSRDQDCH